jgi:hypothetical protein
MEEKTEADLVIEIASGVAVELFIKSLEHSSNDKGHDWSLCSIDFLIDTSFTFAQKLVDKIAKVGNENS